MDNKKQNRTALTWTWNVTGLGIDMPSNTNRIVAGFTLVEQKDGTPYIFRGTFNTALVGTNTFLLKEPTQEKIATNIRKCLLANKFIASKFDINQLTAKIEGSEEEVLTSQLQFVLKENASDYHFILKPEYGEQAFKTFVQYGNNPFVANSNAVFHKGYLIDSNIAKIVEPTTVTQSALPNYITFRNMKSTQGKNALIEMEINSIDIEEGFEEKEDQELIQKEEARQKYIASRSTIHFTEKSTGNEHEIKGTKNENNVNSSTYFIDNEPIITTENIKNCLMKNAFLSSNYSIITPLSSNETSGIVLGNKIVLTSLRTEKEYEIFFSKPEENLLVNIAIKSLPSTSDSVTEGTRGNVDIELEVYTNTGALLGNNDYPQERLGTYMTTLRKAYFGKPLWFNLNALMDNRSTHSNAFLEAEDWCDAGTATDYRFVARRFDGVNRKPIYLSEVLCNITGHNRSLETNDLSAYVYNTSSIEKGAERQIKPLTKQPTKNYVKGQTEYFNFILSDKDKTVNPNMGITFRLYTQSRKLLYEVKDLHNVNKNKLKVVNTIKLKIDEAIDRYQTAQGSNAKQVGYVEVYLSHQVERVENDRKEIVEIESRPLSFRILPECLHKVKDFAFLNALGGWSSFNFEGVQKTDFKSSANTIFKTQTPSSTISSDIESVYSKEVTEQFTVQTAPINKQTAQWLKEMSASKAVYELSTQRYIVVEDLQIKSNTTDDLFRVEMKYR